MRWWLTARWLVENWRTMILKSEKVNGDDRIILTNNMKVRFKKRWARSG